MPGPTAAPSPVVVCGIDGSGAAAAAARAAADEARSRAVPLVLLRAFAWPPQGVAGLPDGVHGSRLARRSAESALTVLAAELSAGSGGPVVQQLVVDGTATDALTTASTAAALLVVGAHGQSWPGGPALGSVASVVARRSSCPVLVHRPRPVPAGVAAGARVTAGDGVLVGLDDGPDSALLLAAAADAARRRGTSLCVLHAWQDGAGRDTGDRAAVAVAVAQLRSRDPQLDVVVRATLGRAGAALVQAGRTAQLVVVGRVPEPVSWHRTAHSLLHRTDAPVLVVPLGVHPVDDPVSGLGGPSVSAEQGPGAPL